MQDHMVHFTSYPPDSLLVENSDFSM